MNQSKSRLNLVTSILDFISLFLFVIAISILIKWALDNAELIRKEDVPALRKKLAIPWVGVLLIVIYFLLRIPLLVLGILQIINSTKVSEGKGITLAAGIFNVLGTSLIAAILSLIAHYKSQTVI